MTVDTWLALAVADAERRGLPELRPLLEGLARATRSLREARFIQDASGADTGSRAATESARPNVIR